MVGCLVGYTLAMILHHSTTNDEEGYAWAYDGGTKQKNFEELRENRRSKGTLLEGKLNFWEFLRMGMGNSRMG